MDKDQEWIAAKDAIARAGSAAKLRPYLRAGAIRARAAIAEIESREQRWLNDFSGMKATKVDWEIAPDIWKGDLTNSRLSLDGDTYSTRAMGTGFKAVKLTGLKYDADGIARAFPGTDAGEGTPERAPEPESDKGGRPLDSVKWGNLVGILGPFFLARDIGNETKGQLYTKVEDYAAKLGVEIPSRGAALPAFDKLVKWAAAVQNDTSGNPTSGTDGKPL
ncbi:hypothetical protein Q9K01_10970 [Qipengyuania sp. DY56-A-20]|uniref:Uncharacterized protein n=1 Tax=Qipengyuania benthica TaxID=3067651 RepID=A0ABT9H9Z7_9SPHN|nr:hypothetical protein [Qipengyuania sp. DY56-A-20]MDP4540149.1 hypothetical protein [Qipengyuania sp. DY56-A-20]